MHHTFHIPVLGLGYSIDTPLKVAKYGISSVMSIVDDELVERMREHHAVLAKEPYLPIGKTEEDSRARRITAYLNLVNKLVAEQVRELKECMFEDGSELNLYFEMLPGHSVLKLKYEHMVGLPEGEEKAGLQKELKEQIVAGEIDVNIMSKVDKANYDVNEQYLGDTFTDALAAMRGYVKSDLNSSIIISAGLNPRLYGYMESCSELYCDATNKFFKKIILKVSDYRSALIQAKMLAKKGLWVEEFRIESGLNCGGHAFATDGFLLGPILQEFKEKKQELSDELYAIYASALAQKGYHVPPKPQQRITAQGGIGTAEEHHFLLDHYQLDAAGWGSPFLLVPEVTNVDEATLSALTEAKESDFYVSNASPLGVLFNNFRLSTAEKQRLERIEKGRPGSPCTKKYLCTNTEFTEQPICTASREYQHLKLKQLANLQLEEQELKRQVEVITEKVCLCEGLCASTYIKHDMLKPRENRAVSICPGPNLAYFSGTFSLREMVDHIYGRRDLLGEVERPNLFVKELGLYVDYLKKDIANHLSGLTVAKEKYFSKFKNQLQAGIAYYGALLPELRNNMGVSLEVFTAELASAEEDLSGLAY